MSTEAVKKFWEKAQQDKALQAKLAAIQLTTVAAIVTLADEAGFAFTAREYDAAVKEELARQYAAGELRDEQMEAIAGGRLFANNYSVADAICGPRAPGRLS